jgi:3'-phosphoadenosine 5'-phosphosulfate sulfotransferase
VINKIGEIAIFNFMLINATKKVRSMRILEITMLIQRIRLPILGLAKLNTSPAKPNMGKTIKG